ncbi:agamous-like MADS-box protein AGL61 [Corylus avellana]|uniref:agamous-like MADS-box protein AGL61 n=1 Tax=Corylus avellana TaxID=13451 RepID=UPI001E1F3DAD|nr:agamous-like MADS-box protein AGL61 [Corylus avellana]
MEKESKKTKGRQKIAMKKIENLDDRLITFSKRRSGIYKKASELATLCGAQVAVVVFSPSGKPFSFGHPSVESVANRFLQKISPESGDTTHPLVEAHRRLRISELNQNYCELVSQLEAERERGKVLQKLTKARESKGWWEAPAEKLSFQELQEMNKSFEELHRNLCSRMKEKIAAGHAGASSSFHAGTTHDHHLSAFPASFGYGGKHF